MGKYNLGSNSTGISASLNKNTLYVNESKTNPIEKEMEAQLEILHSSFNRINELLNRATNLGIVKGKRADVFRSWAKKSKSQSLNAMKLKQSLSEKYAEDVKNYPIQMLDNRIAELEKKIAGM